MAANPPEKDPVVTPEDFALARTLPISSLAMIIARQRQLKCELELADVYRYDSITGLLLRRPFTDEAELRLARHSGALLLLIDVVDFKVINSRTSHNIGDQYLARVAEFLKGKSREYPDLVARFGGDEFAIMAFAERESIAEISELIQSRLKEVPQSPDFPSQIRWNCSVYEGDKTIEQMMSEAEISSDAAKDRAVYSAVNERFPL